MSERVAPKTHYVVAEIGTDVDGLSGVIDGRGMRLAKIFMPDEWTAADMTFLEASAPDGTFYSLNIDNAEVVEKVAAEKVIAISDNAMALSGMCYLKLQSGTAASVVQQAGKRVIGLLFVG